MAVAVAGSSLAGSWWSSSDAVELLYDTFSAVLPLSARVITRSAVVVSPIGGTITYSESAVLRAMNVGIATNLNVALRPVAVALLSILKRRAPTARANRTVSVGVLIRAFVVPWNGFGSTNTIFALR